MPIEKEFANGENKEMLDRSEIKPEDEKTILLKEMDLLQKVFDKYDGWIFKLRAACLTSVAALSITYFKDYPDLRKLALWIPVMGWIVEGMIRWDHWYGYVERYNTIRKFLNSKEGVLNIYDLKDYRDQDRKNFRQMLTFERLRPSFFKQEVLVFYCLIFAFCLLLR